MSDTTCRHGVPDDEPCSWCFYNRDVTDADGNGLCEHNKAPGRCAVCCETCGGEKQIIAPGCYLCEDCDACPVCGSLSADSEICEDCENEREDPDP